MRNRTLVMTALTAVGLVMAWHVRTASSETASPAIPAVLAAAPAKATAPAARDQHRMSPAAAPIVAALHLRTTPAPATADAALHTLFDSRSWTPPPPPPPPPAPPPPPPKPVAPVLPFTYLGKMLEGGKWQAYLARGDDTFVVNEHSQIDANYRAENITPPTMTIVYLPLKQAQVLAIGAGQ